MYTKMYNEPVIYLYPEKKRSCADVASILILLNTLDVVYKKARITYPVMIFHIVVDVILDTTTQENAVRKIPTSYLLSLLNITKS